MTARVEGTRKREGQFSNEAKGEHEFWDLCVGPYMHVSAAQSKKQAWWRGVNATCWEHASPFTWPHLCLFVALKRHQARVPLHAFSLSYTCTRMPPACA